MLADGVRYAFVSNADNLGAVLDPVILEWFAAGGAPFAMETVVGTEADRKGGHIAWRDGRLVLRETAQAPDQHAFQDFRRWRYYNTNNLWLDLEALTSVPALPLIVNRKTVDPRDPSSPEVIQTETAMGAAIGVFEGARALCVPRSRFVPVKTTDDLLALRSDVYRLRDDGRVEAVAEPPYIALDPAYFKRVDDFEARFPHGAPSLRECPRFVVRGDVTLRPRRRGARPRRGLRRRPGRHGAGGGVPSSRGDADVSTGQPREDAKIAFDKERRRRALSRLGLADALRGRRRLAHAALRGGRGRARRHEPRLERASR